MDTNELTAKYICDDDHKERLQMALHVYEAMPKVREHLIKDVFEAVGNRVKMLDSINDVETYEGSVFLRSPETGVYVFAAVDYGGKRKLRLKLHGGVYAEESVDKVKQDKIVERFEGARKGDLGWLNGEYESEGQYVAYAYVDDNRVVADWGGDEFLSTAIRNHNKVVSDVADLLVRIYNGVFVSQ